jgi:hypothetical protein
MFHLTDTELNLFAELLDPISCDEECRLLRDRIETYLALKGHFDPPRRIETVEYIEGNAWRAGEWHAWDGLYDAYGATAEEAIAELHRNMGAKR